jgi:hypothetical protein
MASTSTSTIPDCCGEPQLWCSNNTAAVLNMVPELQPIPQIAHQIVPQIIAQIEIGTSARNRAAESEFRLPTERSRTSDNIGQTPFWWRDTLPDEYAVNVDIEYTEEFGDFNTIIDTDDALDDEDTVVKTTESSE